MITKEELYKIVHDHEIMNDAGTTFIVLDENLKILYVNYTIIDRALKMSPGDLLQCHNATGGPHGCGSHENCKMCSLRHMVEESMHTNHKLETDTDLLVGENTDYSVHAISTPFVYHGKTCSIVLLVDKTDQHREFMMERVFFHDLLNLSGALNGILECIQYGAEPSEMLPIVRSISSQLLEEIGSQRDLIYAKNGILKPKAKTFKASEAIDFVRDSLVHVSEDMWDAHIAIDSTLADEEIDSDKGLVNRVLHNMVKNACEASHSTTITVRGRASGDKVIYSVHNDAVMPDDIKSKVFIYGNSTKGAGRGLGTYSMKLIGENYLKGRVWFRSEEGFGTEFYFEMDQKKHLKVKE